MYSWGYQVLLMFSKIYIEMPASYQNQLLNPVVLGCVPAHISASPCSTYPSV